MVITVNSLLLIFGYMTKFEKQAYPEWVAIIPEIQVYKTKKTFNLTSKHITRLI